MSPGPQAFGRYRLLRELGRGAAGVVYEAEDGELPRRVALKILAPGQGVTDQVLKRFQQEARIGASLSHPNLVKVHDAGEHEGRLFLVLELVEGRPFGEVVRGARGSLAGPLAVLEKAARGVAAAHERGVIHRDLKPENILVDARGEPKVGDFGLAHLEATGQRLTQTGAALGTPLYMAPEQVRGDLAALSPATDVFALGAILYEVLAGRPPFTGKTLAVVYQRIQSAEPTPPSRANPRVAPGLEAVCLKALEKEPARRYRDAGEFAEDLRRFLDGGRVTAARARKRRRPLVPLAAGILLVLAGVAGYLVLRPAPPTPEVVSPEQLARDIDYAYVELCLRTMRAMEELEDRFHGVPGARPAEEPLREIEAVVASSRGRLRVGQAWRGLALVFAGRAEEGTEILERSCVEGGEDPLPDALRARAFMALYATEIRMPGLWLEGDRLLRPPLEETETSGRLRREALRSIERALRRPAWERMSQAVELREYSEGVRLLGAGRHSEAAVRLAAAGASPMLRDEAAFLRGMSLHLAGEYVRAAETWEASMPRKWPRLFQGAGVARLCAGLEAAAKGIDPSADLARAEAHLNLAAAASPNDAFLLIQRGAAYWYWSVAGRPADAEARAAAAVKDVRRAVALAPGHAATLNAAGSILARRALTAAIQGRASAADLQEAVEVLERTIRIDPRRAATHYNAGLLYGQLARLVPAEQAFDLLGRARERHESALRIEESAAVLADLGSVDLHLGELEMNRRGDAESAFRRAWEALERAMKLDPRETRARHNRGVACLRLAQCASAAGRPAEDLYRIALGDFDWGLGLDPADAPVRIARAWTREGLGRFEAALEDFDEAVRLLPDREGPLVDRARFHARRGRLEEALRDYEAAHRLNPAAGLDKVIRALREKLGKPQ